jgi:DivIVA domain-containing protein
MADETLIGADEVARKHFATAFRGFDQYEVRAFLAQVAAELASLQERESSLRERLAGSGAETPAPAAARVFAEDELEAALGAETTRVLHAAREAAAEIRARAEESVARMLREANDEATRMRADAERLLANRTEEAEVSASAILESAEHTAAAVAADADAAAAALIDEAQARGREMLGEAQAVRERVLKDLARKRKVAGSQLEQLLAARERLLAAYDVVRSTLEEATNELSVAETEARLAAEAAAMRSGAEGEGGGPEVADGAPVEAAAPVPPEEPVPERVVLDAEPGPEPEARASEPGPSPKDEDRRSSSLRLLRRRPDGPDAGALEGAPLDDDVESVRIIRPTSIPTPVPAPDPGPAPEPASAIVPRPVVVPDLPVEPVPTDASDTSDASDEGRSSDDLFARLRAERAAALEQAEAVLAAEPTPPLAPEAEAEREAEAAPDPEPVPGPGEESRFERRDAALEPTERGLTKAIKRALADEQNEVLDSLRRLRGTPKIEAVLPSPDEHVTRFSGIVVEHLHEAAAAGASSSAGATPDVADLAAALGGEVSDDLRVRIGRALDATGSDEEALVEAISATYREWKTARAEPFARHHAAAAYAYGAFSGAPADELVWVVDRAEGGCPDCDDNALAGPTARGSAYPTGQLYPPAHAGCRCLVLPAT